MDKAEKIQMLTNPDRVGRGNHQGVSKVTDPDRWGRVMGICAKKEKFTSGQVLTQALKGCGNTCVPLWACSEYKCK